jgi:branched-chain amino acid transport system permease protein
VLLVAVAALVEMVYHRQLNAAMGSVVNFMGVALDTTSAQSWLGLCAVLALGSWVFALAQRRFGLRWDAAQEAIEKETNTAGAAL